MIRELESVALRCDGVRCDMAMLVLQDVFARNWVHFPNLETDPEGQVTKPASEDEVPGDFSEFWVEAIGAVKKARPQFLFLAEAYWGLEERLITCGFDFAYDKTLLDELLAGGPSGVARHLRALPANALAARAHFLENHDEPRIASRLALGALPPAALLLLCLPSMRMLYHGQLTGAKIRASIHLRRVPLEEVQPEIAAFYEQVLAKLPETAVGRGQSKLLEPLEAWEGNPSAGNFVVIQWQLKPDEFDLVVLNLAGHPSQCFVKLAIDGLSARDWRARNLLGTEEYVRTAKQFEDGGLFLDAASHAAQLFHFVATGEQGRS
jgi:hypothetical protein